MAPSKVTFTSEKVSLASVLGLVELGVDFSNSPSTCLGYDSDRDPSGLVLGLAVGLGPTL